MVVHVDRIPQSILPVSKDNLQTGGSVESFEAMLVTTGEPNRLEDYNGLMNIQEETEAELLEIASNVGVGPLQTVMDRDSLTMFTDTEYVFVSDILDVDKVQKLGFVSPVIQNANSVKFSDVTVSLQDSAGPMVNSPYSNDVSSIIVGVTAEEAVNHSSVVENPVPKEMVQMSEINGQANIAAEMREMISIKSDMRIMTAETNGAESANPELFENPLNDINVSTDSFRMTEMPTSEVSYSTMVPQMRAEVNHEHHVDSEDKVVLSVASAFSSTSTPEPFATSGLPETQTERYVPTIVPKIVEHVTRNLQDVSLFQNELSFTLDPESLGKVTIKMSIEEGILTVEFFADNEETRTVLASNLEAIRDVLKNLATDNHDSNFVNQPREDYIQHQAENKSHHENGQNEEHNRDDSVDEIQLTENFLSMLTMFGTEDI